MLDKSKISVLLVDDHAAVREGVRSCIDTTNDIYVIGEAADGNEALQRLNTVCPDVLLLDVMMPKMGGIDVLHRVMQRGDEVNVLIYSMYAEEQYAISFLQAGASGYLSKGTRLDELLKAIRQIASGKRYITDKVASLLADKYIDKQTRFPHEQLSTREFQVLCHLAAGENLTEMAEQMNLSIRTISTYRSRLLSKMRMKNNAELIHYAARNGLIHS